MITFFHNNILIKHLPFVQIIIKKNKKKLKKKPKNWNGYILVLKNCKDISLFGILERHWNGLQIT